MLCTLSIGCRGCPSTENTLVEAINIKMLETQKRLYMHYEKEMAE
jgi:Fe-S cluster biogenesis protein NfuA